MRAKRATSRNANSNTEFSDDTSAGEMEREQRRVRSNRLSQQRYREKGNEARLLLPRLQNQIIELQRENDFLKSLLWQQRDPNSYAMAQQQQREWNIVNGHIKNGEHANNAFPQRVMSETSIPSLFNNGHQMQQQLPITPTTEFVGSPEWRQTATLAPPLNDGCVGGDFYVPNSAAPVVASANTNKNDDNCNNNDAIMDGEEGSTQQQQPQQQQNQQNLGVANNGGGGGGIYIARTRPIKRPSVRRSVSALNIPISVTMTTNGADQTNGNNGTAAVQFGTSPHNQQYLMAVPTTYGQSLSPPNLLNGGGQPPQLPTPPTAADCAGQYRWLSSPNGAPLPPPPPPSTTASQSPMPTTQHYQQQQASTGNSNMRCRSASITVTPTSIESQQQQILFNTSLNSNFGQSMSQQQISPSESPFDHDASFCNEQHQQQHHDLLPCPPAPKRSSSFSDMCASYQQMNIQEGMHPPHSHANDIQQQYHHHQQQQQQQFSVQQQQQQPIKQVDGFFAPPFAYGIELDPNGPQTRMSSSVNHVAHFSSFQGLELTPINEDTPRLYLEH